MKRVDEVFKLSVSTDFDFEHNWSAEDEGDDICLSGFNPIASGGKVVLLAVASSKAYSGIDSRIEQIADATIKAISHVDALADALEGLLNRLHYEGCDFADMAVAATALAKYRGDL